MLTAATNSVLRGTILKSELKAVYPNLGHATLTFWLAVGKVVENLVAFQIKSKISALRDKVGLCRGNQSNPFCPSGVISPILSGLQG